MRPGRVAVAAFVVWSVGAFVPPHVAAQATPTQTTPTVPPPNIGRGLNGWTSIDPSGGTIALGAQNSTSSPGSGGSDNNGGSGDDGGASRCQWTFTGSQSGGNGIDPAGDVLLGAGGGLSGSSMTPVANDATGSWYLMSCPGQAQQSIFVPAGSGPGPVTSPQQLAVEATNLIKLQAPQLQMSPPSNVNPNAWQYVNLPTWVWLTAAQWVPLHATASVPGVEVTATAVPAQLVLTYQSGGGIDEGVGSTEQVVCNGPGTPYSNQLAAQENPEQPVLATSPDCGWTWERSAAGSPDEKLEVTATVVYDASWTVTGASGGGDLGTITSPVSSYRVTVGEIESLNTGSS